MMKKPTTIQKTRRMFTASSLVPEASSQKLAEMELYGRPPQKDHTTTQGVGVQKVNKWLTKAQRMEVSELSSQRGLGAKCEVQIADCNLRCNRYVRRRGSRHRYCAKPLSRQRLIERFRGSANPAHEAHRGVQEGSRGGGARRSGRIARV